MNHILVNRMGGLRPVTHTTFAACFHLRALRAHLPPPTVPRRAFNTTSHPACLEGEHLHFTAIAAACYLPLYTF